MAEVTASPDSSDGKSNFASLKVSDLRKYLRDHGLPISGCKSDLIDRANGSLELKTKPLSELNSFDATLAQNYQQSRSVTPLGETLIDVDVLTQGWSRDMSQLPHFTDAELYNYLVLNDNRTFDLKPINAKRQLKAKVFYTDRHLHSVEFNEIDRNISHCYVRAKCIRSIPGMATNKAKYEYRVWTCLSKISGRVHSAGCECSAGEGEACNHISALMYALVDISQKKKDGLDVCTSVECLWNRPSRSRKLSPKRLTDINFKKQKFDTKDEEPKEKRKCIKLTINPMNMERFTNKINPHAAVLLSQREFIHKFKKTKRQDTEETNLGLPLPPFMYRQTVDLSSEKPQIEFQNYMDSLTLTQKQCELIERKTIKQNINSNWTIARADRITSSNFGAIMKRRIDIPPTSLIKTVLGYNTTFNSDSTKWGRNHEPAARRVYVKDANSKHQSLNVSECGLLTNTRFPYLGSSPDGLIHCEHCEDPLGTLEIKCPYKYRLLSPYDAAKQSDFFCELVDDKVKLKKNHNYYYQIQGQMGIAERKWCDFFVWTLEGFNVERIKFDNDLWENMISKLECFFKQYVVPEIFTRQIKLSSPK